jgi:hypothetical protein
MGMSKVIIIVSSPNQRISERHIIVKKLGFRTQDAAFF